MTNRWSCFGLMAVAGAILFSAAYEASATDTVNLPCAAFSSGSSWRYSEKSAHGSTISTATVSLVQGDEISIIERTTISQRIHADGHGRLPDADQLVRKKLARRGNTVYLASYTMELKAAGTFETRTSLGPGAGAPECGELPATAQYDRTTFVHGKTTRERVKVVTTAAGAARVVVPAGEFDTVAVRRVYTVTHVAGFSGPRPPTLRTEILINAADKVGIVRTETTTQHLESSESATAVLLSYQMK